MKYNVVKSNSQILLNKNGYANYDIDSNEKLIVISYWNLIGRLIKWIRNLNGVVTIKVNLAVLHTLQEMQKSQLSSATLPSLAKKLVVDPQFVNLTHDKTYRQIFDITQSVFTPSQQSAPQNTKNSKAQLQPTTNNPPKSTFQSYSFDLQIPGSQRQNVDIKSDQDVEKMVNTLVDQVISLHASVEINFDRPFKQLISTNLGFDDSIKWNRIKDELSKLNAFPLAKEKLIFEINHNKSYKYAVISIRPKPELIETLPCGNARLTYPNGIVEICSQGELGSQSYTGTRQFPDGRKEVGEIGRLSGKLKNGYCVGSDGVISYVDPKFFISCKELDKSEFVIVEVEGKLTPLKKMWNQQKKHPQGDYEYETTTTSIVEIILKGCRYDESKSLAPWINQSILPLLQRPDFGFYLDAFFNEVFNCDGKTTPPLFELSNTPVLEILEMASSRRAIDPLKLVDPVTGRNFFMEAVHRGNIPLLEKMIALFPAAFATEGTKLLTLYLECGHQADFAKILAQKLGSQIDPYLMMHVQVAKKQPIDPKAFDLLDVNQKKKLYVAAYLYNNPSLYEPAHTPVKADEYSINFTRIDRPIHVTSICDWAKVNPGTAINIWIDSEFTDKETIEKKKIEFDNELWGTSHGTIIFRDVRTIDFVQKNSFIFTDKIDKDFRGEFLREIIANHILSNKECKYFVCSDNYRGTQTPLKNEEIFDQRSLDFLQDFGLILKKSEFSIFDDTFEILNGENAQLMDSHKKVMIDLTLELILNDPNSMKKKLVYDHYSPMFAHLLHTQGKYGKYQDPSIDINLLDSNEELKLFRSDVFNHHNCNYEIHFENETIDLKKVLPLKPIP